MKITEYDSSWRPHYENLGKYDKTKQVVNGHEFTFVVERTRASYRHACSVDDVVRLLEQIPVDDYGELDLIVFRQPKRKEAILESVWGCFVYCYEFEHGDHYALILEAVSLSMKLKWGRALLPDEQKELERLKEDGHVFVESRRGFEAEVTLENARNTQLYRTLPHEFVHYVDYLNRVERPATDDEEAWEKRNQAFFTIPSVEKERFAHGYADKLRQRLKKEDMIFTES